MKTVSFTEFTGKHLQFFLVFRIFGSCFWAYYKKTGFANGKLHKSAHLGLTPFGATKHSFLSIGQLLCFPILPYCGTGHQLKHDVIANLGATQELQKQSGIYGSGRALHSHKMLQNTRNNLQKIRLCWLSEKQMPTPISHTTNFWFLLVEIICENRFWQRHMTRAYAFH